MVDDGGNHSVLPLATQEGANFRLGTRQIKMGKAERNQRRIPVPLVGILVRSRLGEDTRIVCSQNGDRPFE
jgi:hypothetical protein